MRHNEDGILVFTDHRKGGGSANHDYKMKDFRFMEGNDDTDLREPVVSVMLDHKSVLPECLVRRMERTINKMISDHEEMTGQYIPLEDMELEMHLDADTVQGELSFEVYISYSPHEEYLSGREIFRNKEGDDEEYHAIRQFFLQQVAGVLYRQYAKIRESV